MDVPVTESNESDLLQRMTSVVSPDQTKRVVDPAVSSEPAAGEQEVVDVVDETDQASEPEDQDGETDEGQSSAEPTVELEHLGKKYVVPQSLKTAFEANRAQANRVPQEVVEMRKMLHIERQVAEAQRAFQQHAKPEFDELARLEGQIEQFKTVDWQSLDTDQLVKTRQFLDTLKDKRDDMRKAIGSKEQQFQQNLTSAMQQAKEHGHAYLTKKIPSWNDETAAQAYRYALEKGFTQEEASSFYDPRAVEILWEAMQYRKLVSSKPQVMNKVREAPPVIRPGMSDATKSVSASKDKALRERLRKSGSVEDAAAWLLNKQKSR